MQASDLVTTGQVRSWRRKAVAAVVVVAFLAAVLGLASTLPVASFAPYLGLLALAVLTEWFPWAVRNWQQVDQSVWKSLGAHLPRSAEARAWTPPEGVVLLGVTVPGMDAVDVDGEPYATWSKADPHMLLSGASGTGKTSTVRTLGLALIQAGYATAFLDGKGAGSFAGFAGRDGVLGVADTPGEWCDLAGLVDREMFTRYEALRSWRYGLGPRPVHRPIALVSDELVDAIALLRSRGVDYCISKWRTR